MLTPETHKGNGDVNIDPAIDTEENMMNNKKGPVRIEKDTLNDIEDGKEAMENDPMTKAWLDSFTERKPKGKSC